MIKPIYTLLATLLVTLLGVVWIRTTWGPPGDPLDVSAQTGERLLELSPTGARLAGEDYVQTAVSYAQTIYAAAQDKDRPGAVILVRDDDPAVAMATTRLQHMPVNAPLLFVTEGGTVLPQPTKDELERLGPEGVMMDNNVQVYLVGDIAEAVNEEVEEMGLHTRQISAGDPVEYAEVLDEFLAVLDGNHADVVLVAHLDALEFAYGGANWNAHMGQGWAFVTDEGVPGATRRILSRRAPSYTYVYVFAPPDVIGEDVMAELSLYGHVQRIPGDTPQEMAIRWAGYKDLGRQFGWWFGQAHRDIGWGYAEPGHNLLVATPQDWRVIVPSGVLSHMGKHAMLMLLNEDGTIPEVMAGYANILQPTFTHPSQQLFTYAWFLGQGVSEETMDEFSDMIAVNNGREVVP
jgi:hypothetical protein